MIQVQNNDGVNPFVTIGDIANRVSGLFDDTPLSGAAFSGTGVSNFLSIRSGGTEVSFNDQRKVYEKIVIYSFKITGG